MNSNLINHANEVCHIKDKARKNEMVKRSARQNSQGYANSFEDLPRLKRADFAWSMRS